jgi:hypothetical protein
VAISILGFIGDQQQRIVSRQGHYQKPARSRMVGDLRGGGAEGFVRAVWYERQGPADEVLRVGELPAPEEAAWGAEVGDAVSTCHPAQ